MTATSSSREHVPAWVPGVGIVASALFALGGAAIVWTSRGSLPGQLAHHWGASGHADGFESVRAYATFQAAFPLAMGVLLVVFGWLLRTPRSMAVFASSMSAFLGVLLTLTALAQRGVTDPAGALLAQWVMFPALGAALVVAGLVWLLVRRRGPLPRADATDATDVRALPVSGGTRVAWSGRTRGGKRSVWLLIGVGVLPMVVITLVAAVNRQWGMAGFMLIPALFVLVLGTFLRADVTIGRDGVRAKGLGLVPLVSIPLENIRRATLVPKVSALGGTGGYGYRIGLDGTRYLATADGPGLRIEREGFPPTVITVEDAERAVAVVNTLVAQRDGLAGSVR